MRLDFGASIPLVVCYGMGVDSTAILVGLQSRGIVPDLILFADAGAERQPTYDYMAIANNWLLSVGFPTITVVKYQPTNFKHWPPYHSIEENCLTNVTLPSIAYGRHSCSSKWKIDAQNKFIESWEPAIDCWFSGKKVRKMIGFEDSPHERKRSQRCGTYAIQDEETDKYDIEFPLQEWGWDRERCISEIESSSLPHAPCKSSCYFCTAMKPWELDELAIIDPDKLRRIVIIEARTRQRHLDYAKSKGWPKGVDVPLTDGLWRKPVKGMRGATARPGSMTEYIRDKGLLPSSEVDALIAITPTNYFSKADFERDGISGWQDWIQRICDKAKHLAACHEFSQLEP
jgi:hypothetical protein